MMRLASVVLVAMTMLTAAACGDSGDHAPPAMTEAPKNGVKDPVCGMIVDAKNAPAKADYKGKTYYFCSREDKDRFEKAPDQFVK